MGLATKAKLKGKKRLSHQFLEAVSWERMSSYHELRQTAGISVAKIPIDPNQKLQEESNAAVENKEAHVSDQSCDDCGTELDKLAVKWALDRCSPCQNQLLNQ